MLVQLVEGEKDKMKIKEETRIYILSPYFETGGPKSLHQLAACLLKNDIETYIVYYEDDEFVTTDVKGLFADYNVPIAKGIVDEEDNILLVPETATYFLRKVKSIQTVIWWLSVDFYFQNSIISLVINEFKRGTRMRILFPLIVIKRWHERNKMGYVKIRRVGIMSRRFQNSVHLYNCEYAHRFLRKKHVKDMHYLCGPLEDYFLNLDRDEVSEKKNNIVAYSPTKADRKYMNAIMEEVKRRSKDIQFVEIRNMSSTQVKETLSRSKVYLDLGNFPGPERIPREAVCLYCNIITSNLGSAANNEDVPIPNDFKVAIRQDNITRIVDLITDMIYSYGDYLDSFDKYRQHVYGQIQRFQGDINEIFKREDSEI